MDKLEISQQDDILPFLDAEDRLLTASDKDALLQLALPREPRQLDELLLLSND